MVRVYRRLHLLFLAAEVLAERIARGRAAGAEVRIAAGWSVVGVGGGPSTGTRVVGAVVATAVAGVAASAPVRANRASGATAAQGVVAPWTSGKVVAFKPLADGTRTIPMRKAAPLFTEGTWGAGVHPDRGGQATLTVVTRLGSAGRKQIDGCARSTLRREPRGLGHRVLGVRHRLDDDSIGV